MKRLLLSFAMAFPCLWSNAQTDGDVLFDQSFLHEIRINSPDTDFYEQMVDLFYLNFGADQPYLPATVTIDGNVLDSIGARIKGALSSFAYKKPFKLDFNEFVENGEYDGVKKLNLQSAYFDATLQREAIAYEIFRQAGVKAPRTAFAEVYVNDELHGLYTMVEQVDKGFLSNYFASDEGVLYKNKFGDLVVDSGDDDYSFYNEMNPTASISDDAEFQEAIEPMMDTEAFLRYMLIEVFINATDNPLTVDQNYYLYHEPNSDLLTWIPWDFNFALFPGSNYPLVYEGTGNPLFKRMLNHPVYRKRYLDLACDFLQSILNEEGLHSLIDSNFNLIADAVAADPRHDFYGYGFVEETENMKALMTQRISVFNADLIELGHICPAFAPPTDFQGIVINEFVASNNSSSGIADQDDEYEDWIELYNNTEDTIFLKNCYLSVDRDFKKHWRFPNDSWITPDDYLIVWADRDIDQAGLHTDFKLNKDTSEIYLIFENNYILDSVSYGAQSTNIPYARYPNGTGEFIFHQITFGENNEQITGEKQIELNTPYLNIYPNPNGGYFKMEFSYNDNLNNSKAFVYNTLGEILMEKKITETIAFFDLTYLPTGIYFLEIKTENGSMTDKVVIKK